MKKRIALLLATAIVVSTFLTACGNASTSTASSAPASSAAPAASSSLAAASSAPAEAAPVEIRAAWWGDTGRNELYGKIVDEFQKVHTNVTVTAEPVSWTDYWDKLAVQAAGGNAPDFMSMHTVFAADYIPRGVCEPLDPFIADGTITTDGWAEGTLKTGVYDGVNYMMAMGVTFTCNLINLTGFKELGIDPPPFAWTWDDVKSIGQKVREAYDAKGIKNQWLIGDSGYYYDYFRFFVRENGRELYDTNGEIQFTKADVEEWFTMYKDLRDANLIPDGATTTEYIPATLEDSLFSRNKVLVQSVPVNQYKLYCTTFPDKEIGIIRFPQKAGGPTGEFFEGAHFAVSAKTTPEKKLAAAQLLNFWVNDERSLVIFGLDQGVPGNLKVGEAVLPTLDEYQKKIVEHINIMSPISSPTTWAPAGASELGLMFRNFGEQVHFNAIDPASAAQQVYDQALELVAKNKK